MSGPKCAQYAVVSVEELNARRLAAAKERYERRLAAAKERYAQLGTQLNIFREEASGANATFSQLSFIVPELETVDVDDAGKIEESIDRLNKTLSRMLDEFNQVLAAARIDYFSYATSSLEMSSSENIATSQVVEIKLEGELEKIFARIPGESRAEILSRCLSLAQQYKQATDTSRRNLLLDSLRLIIQQESDRIMKIAENRLVIENFYAKLDGLVGREVEKMRGFLKGLSLEEEFPLQLDAEVEAIRTTAVDERDRVFVMSSAIRALSELGYKIGENFQTAVPSNGTLLNLPHSPHHGVMLREHCQQLLINVVRFSETGNRDAVDDKRAEESFCEDFSIFRSKLAEEGIALDMLRMDPPGLTQMQVLKGKTAGKSSSKIQKVKEVKP